VINNAERKALGFFVQEILQFVPPETCDLSILIWRDEVESDAVKILVTGRRLPLPAIEGKINPLDEITEPRFILGRTLFSCDLGNRFSRFAPWSCL
jgi:hypothetical protein